jgi:hypothetical protein
MNAAVDDANTSAPASARAHGIPGESLKWWIEKCALPLALMLGPIFFQIGAGYLARQASAQEEELARGAREREAKQAADNKAEQTKREQVEQKFQLYTNLLTKREADDTAVRLGLFDKVIGSYWNPKTSDLQSKLVQLELLALNFHDSLNLNPLFWELYRSIDQSSTRKRRVELLDQLDRVARDVKVRQAALLEVGGFRQESITVDLSAVEDASAKPGTKAIWNAVTTPPVKAPRINDSGDMSTQKECEFSLSVPKHHPKARRVWVDLKAPGCMTKSLGFWVDLYDFPLATFSRISPSARVAVILNQYEEGPKAKYARLELLYFPSSRSAAKDKPYVEDLLIRLRTPEEAPAAASAPTGASAPGK